MRGMEQLEVIDHEPSMALNGGTGVGMDALNLICQQSSRMLAPGGFLALETGGQVNLDSSLLNVAQC